MRPVHFTLGEGIFFSPGRQKRSKSCAEFIRLSPSYKRSVETYGKRGWSAGCDPPVLGAYHLICCCSDNTVARNSVASCFCFVAWVAPVYLKSEMETLEL